MSYVLSLKISKQISLQEKMIHKASQFCKPDHQNAH